MAALSKLSDGRPKPSPLMSTAFLETPYSRVKLHSERLFVVSPQQKDKPDELLAEIPLNELERIVVHEHVFITSPAVVELMRRNIPLHYLDAYGHPLADCLPVPPPAGDTRLRHYQRALEPEFGLGLARGLVAAKIFNQHRVVQRLDLNHPQGIDTELQALADFEHRSSQTGDLGSLRGVEGASTALYFQLWARFLPEAFPFERRSTRPPHNAVNACISFAATLLYQELRAALHLSGLDAALGFFHANDDSRYSLALDLMEPFRPAVGEALTLRLYTLGLHVILRPLLGMLQAGNFEPSHGGIYLNAAGRRTFLREYEQRLAKEFNSEHAGHRTSLRQQLRAAALDLKAALIEPGGFRPFRLN